MSKNWTELFEVKDKDGKSAWKSELEKIEDYKEVIELYDFLDNELRKDIEKFFIKGNRVAGRRARYNAQKIKDAMGQLRNIIQKNVSKK